MLYYIRHKGYCGNCYLWWAEDGKGYTTNLDKAWKVTKAQAESICSDRPKEDIMYLISVVDSLCVRHFTGILGYKEL